MALFFDKAWFDAVLRERGLSRADLATAAHVSAQDVSDMFKDQQEVSPACVSAWSALLEVSKPEIALRCGVTTRVEPKLSDSARITALESRVFALEDLCSRLARQLSALSPP